MKTLRRIRELICESTRNILIPRGQINIPRYQMPQIEFKDYEEYFDLLRLRNIKIERVNLQAKYLRAAQNEIDVSKVQKWAIHMPPDAARKPCIISKDKYILDGNHTWLGYLNRDPNIRVSCYEIDLNIVDLLNITKLFDKVTNKTIKEELDA